MYRKEDVVIYINTMLPFGAALAGRLTGKPVYFHIHEISLQPKGLKWFLRLVVQHTATKVIFVSRAVRDSESFRHVHQKVVYNGLPAELVDSARERVYSWKQKGIFSVLMVSSLKDYKGLPELFEMARLCESRDDVKFTLVLNAGTHEIDSYFYAQYLPKNLFVAPRQKDLVPFYRETSLLLNLSRPDEWVETFGLTILEAMAFGIPVIVPPVGGPAELVTDGVEGYQLSCYDKDAVAARILELASDEKQCLKLSENARKRSLDFSEETFNAEILKAIGD
jgi:glycosyltransferase involved in cell wall biosynthesis